MSRFSKPILPLDIESVKGFLPEHEAAALFHYASEAAQRGACVEIGSYCGKSTVYLGTAYKDSDHAVFAIDHHRGSEEHQQGEGYFDAELFDAKLELVNSFPLFQKAIRDADLENVVVPIVAPSTVVARSWGTPLAMLFIDGGHSEQAAQADYVGWAGHVQRGGLLAIHDVFPNPEEGGRPPFHIYQQALASKLFEEIDCQDSLRILRRL